MKKVLTICFFFCAMLWLVAACKKETISPDEVQISFKVPDGWPQPVYAFAGNPLTSDGFTLGRKLFYDVRLSRDNTVSCGSCHQQFGAFSHFDHPVSHGIYGLLGKRNTPGLSNTAWQFAYFWDGGVINLENQPINPIQNHVEMDMTMQEVIGRVSADADYQLRFKKVFGDNQVNSQRIFRALAQFMGAMVSSNSKYDKYTRDEDGVDLTAQELRGLTLFRAKCATCHIEPLFSDYSYRNNGLAPDAAINDSGRAHITLNENDLYRFKVPSLRNVELTKPYMHDGRFETLEAVVEHYRTGIYPSATLDASLTNGIAMSDGDKADIVSFLKTLTDTTFTKDKRFAQPD